MHPLPQTGVLTFVFTDIEGSTSRWDRAPDAMAKALAMHDTIVSETLQAHGGSVFKRVGDAFCCVFPSPVNACVAVVETQRRLASQAWDRAVGELHIRAGIHTGSALAADDDYFGPTLNRVARLMSTAHGGQIVLSAVTAALVRGELPPDYECANLGSHRLRDLAEPETIFQLSARDLARSFPALKTLDARPNNLPLELSTFVGRETELRELRELLAKHRLITLCGPGGIGKTRLALQLAAESLEDFGDGVWFVRLASTSDQGLIAQTIASAMSIAEAAGEAIETTLLRELAPKKLLVILDNAEHLLPAIAQTARAILDRANGARIVTTSRESLHVRGEQIYRLGPFDEPAAARLFIERARSLVHDFALAAADSEDFAAITQSLQGIPLALELAAARVSTLSIHQIRERLGEQLAFLRAPAAEDDRHRTLRETIAWSYGLLDGSERTLLGKLAIFSDSFTLTACEQIEPDCLDRLDALVDKSFVTATRDAEDRYRMLEIIREYALEQSLPESVQDARAKHYVFFSSLAQHGKETLPHDSLREWLEEIDNDLANVRGALSYGFEKRDVALGKTLAGMWRYWLIRRKVKEGRMWLQRYIDSKPENQNDFAGVLRRASAFASIEGEYEASESFAKKALTIYHAAADEAGILEALHALAVNENRRGNYAGAERLYSDIAARCTQAGQERAAVTSSANCAMMKMQKSDLPAAQVLLADCRRRAEALGDDDIYATVLALHGTLAFRLAQWETAEAYFSQALKIKTELKNEFGVAEINTAMGAVAVKEGNPGKARACIRRGLQIALAMDAFPQIINSLEVYALAAMSSGDFDEAKRAFSAALTIRRTYSLNERNALGRDEVETELNRRYAADLNASGADDWKATIRALALWTEEASPVTS